MNTRGVFLSLSIVVLCSCAALVGAANSQSLFFGGDFSWSDGQTENIGGVAEWRISGDVSQPFSPSLVGGGLYQRSLALQDLLPVQIDESNDSTKLFFSGDFQRVGKAVSHNLGVYDEDNGVQGMGGGIWPSTSLYNLDINDRALPWPVNSLARWAFPQSDQGSPALGYVIVAGAFSSLPGGDSNMVNVARYDLSAKKWSALPTVPSNKRNTVNAPCTPGASCTIISLDVDSGTGRIYVVTAELQGTDEKSQQNHLYYYEPSIYTNSTTMISEWVGGQWNMASKLFAVDQQTVMRVVANSLVVSSEKVFALGYSMSTSAVPHYWWLPANFYLLSWNKTNLASDPKETSLWQKNCTASSLTVDNVMIPTIAAYSNGVLVGYPSTSIKSSCSGDTVFQYYSGSSTKRSTPVPSSLSASKVHSSLTQLISIGSDLVVAADRHSIYYCDTSTRSKSWSTLPVAAASNTYSIQTLSWSDQESLLYISLSYDESMTLSASWVATWNPQHQSQDAEEVFTSQDILRYGRVEAINSISSPGSAGFHGLVVAGQFSQAGGFNGVPALPCRNVALWTGESWIDLGIRDSLVFQAVASAVINGSSDSPTVQVYALSRDLSYSYQGNDQLPLLYFSLPLQKLTSSSLVFLPSQWQSLSNTPVFVSQGTAGSYDLSHTRALYIDQTDELNFQLYIGGQFTVQFSSAVSEVGNVTLQQAQGLVSFDSLSQSWSGLVDQSTGKALDLPQVNDILAVHPTAGSGQKDILYLVGDFPALDHTAVWDLQAQTLLSSPVVLDSSSRLLSLAPSPSDSTVYVGGTLKFEGSGMWEGAMAFQYGNQLGMPFSALGHLPTEGTTLIYDAHSGLLFAGNPLNGETWEGCLSLRTANVPSARRAAVQDWQAVGTKNSLGQPAKWNGQVGALALGPSTPGLPDYTESYRYETSGAHEGGGADVGEIVGLTSAVLVTVAIVLGVGAFVGYLLYKRQKKYEVEYV